MNEIFALLIAFQIKHFLADYPLQNAYMLRKTERYDWVMPLSAHSFVHAFMTLVIIHFVDSALWWLAIVDYCIHFTIDRIKASPFLLNRFEIFDKRFWWALGWDQMMHHLTHYGIIYVLVAYGH